MSTVPERGAYLRGQVKDALDAIRMTGMASRAPVEYQDGYNRALDVLEQACGLAPQRGHGYVPKRHAYLKQDLYDIMAAVVVANGAGDPDPNYAAGFNAALTSAAVSFGLAQQRRR